jgi:hypothetical protein
VRCVGISLALATVVRGVEPTTGLVSEKFVGVPTFQVTTSRDFNTTFGDRVFGALTRALGLIVRSAPEQENQVLGEG